LVSTSHTLENWRIARYVGVVSAHVVAGTGFFSDLAASFTDVLGGRSGTYQRQLAEIHSEAIQQLQDEAAKRGANAIVGLSVDHDEVSGGAKSQMFMVTAMGTAVLVEPADATESKSSKPAGIQVDGAAVDLEVCRLAIARKLEDRARTLDEKDWEAAISGRFDSLAPGIAKLVGRIQADGSEPDYAPSSDEVKRQIDAARAFFLSIDPRVAAEVLVPLLLVGARSSRRFALDVLSDGRIVDYCLIADVLPDADQSAKGLLLELLVVGRMWYSTRDLDGIRRVRSAVEQYVPVVAEPVERRGPLGRGTRQMWKCQCGCLNAEGQSVCSSCGADAYGLKQAKVSPTAALEHLADRALVLSELLKTGNAA
jgi:uncharacterized protein YbjQ (UPF0145 family)